MGAIHEKLLVLKVDVLLMHATRMSNKFCTGNVRNAIVKSAGVEKGSEL